MTHRIVSTRRGGAVRRASDWGFITGGFTTLAGAGTAVLVASLNATALAMRPFTVVRTHLELLISSDQTAASERQIAAIGLAIVSDQASAIGITAVPTPVTDAGSDLWFAHQWMMNDFIFVSGTGIETNAGRRYVIDSKAMRKVNADEDLIMVVENQLTGGSVIGSAGRFLLKLH